MAGRAGIAGGEAALAGLLLVVVGLLAVLPLARLLYEGVAPGGRFDPSLVLGALSARPSWLAFGRTLATGLASSALALVLGGAMALLLGLTDIRGKPALAFAFLLPLMIPSQITAIAWIDLLGPASPLLGAFGLAPAPGSPHPLYGFAGISLVEGIEHAPLAFLALGAALRRLPREALEAAEASGAGAWRRLIGIVLPMTAPALVAGAALAFVSAIGNFGTPALLGIPAGYTVLSVLIYQKLAGFGPSAIGEVAALSLLLLALALAGVWLQGRFARRYAAAEAEPPAAPARLGRVRPLVELALWAALGLVVGAPLAALLAASLVAAEGVTLSLATAGLENYRYVLFDHDATLRGFADSLGLAAGAALILAMLALPLGYLVAWRPGRLARLLSLAAELPYALPGGVLAIAAILVFLRPLPLLGLRLYDTLGILLLAYVARFLALALRPVVAGYLMIDRNLEEAARMTGAGLARRLLTIALPLVAPALAAGALLVFLVAFNELTLSALLWSAGHETLGVVVFSLEQGGESGPAAALAMLCALATLALMALTSLAARRLSRGVLPWQA